MDKIDEKKLLEIGFVYGDFPEMIFPLNDETSLILAYAENKWYAGIRQFQGLKPPPEYVYIPKDIIYMNHVYLLIACMAEFENGSYIHPQHFKLSERIKEQNRPTKLSDLNNIKNNR